VFCLEPDVINAEQLAKQNYDYWASIPDFMLTFHVEYMSDDEKITLRKVDGIWIKRNNKENVCYTWEAVENSDYANDGKRECYFFDGEKTYIYKDGQKNDKNKKLNPCIPPQNLFAQIIKGKKDTIVFAPNLLDKLSFPSVGEPKYLFQIIKDCQLESIEKSINNGGDELCTIKLKVIAPEEEANIESSEFVINRSKNFLIDSFLITEYYKSSKILRKLQVMEYKEIEMGKWIPSQIDINVSDENNSLFSKTIIKVDSFSTALSTETELSEVVFPSNILVPETDENGKVIAVHIWGVSGKPAFTFTSEKEFDSYMESHCGKFVGTENISLLTYLPRIIMALVGIIMIVLVIYLKIRIIKR
jgi:hypothetical protein